MSYDINNNTDGSSSNTEKQSLLHEIKLLTDKITDLEQRAEKSQQIANDIIESGEESLKYDFSTPTPEMTTDNNTSHGSGIDSGTDVNLDEDTFTLMMTACPGTKPWWFAFITYMLQMALIILIFIAISETHDTPFEVPSRVSLDTTITQFLSTILIVGFASDVIKPIKEMSMLWYTNQREWEKNHQFECWYWCWHHWFRSNFVFTFSERLDNTYLTS